MRIQIATKVEQDFGSVFAKFDLTLFKKLKPFLTGMKVEKFDGCKKGDEVHVEINTFGWKQQWKSLITENGSNAKEIYFVDEGLQLPKPLKKWRHRHEIVKFIDNSIIIDNIAYSTGIFLLDLMLYPLLYIAFFQRKCTYKRYFKK